MLLKLKEINIAYETLMTFSSSKQALELGRKINPSTQAEGEIKSDTGKRTGDASEDYMGRKESEAGDRTEAIAEAGTRIALSLWSFFSSKIRQISDSQIFNGEADEKEKK